MLEVIAADIKLCKLTAAAKTPAETVAISWIAAARVKYPTAA